MRYAMRLVKSADLREDFSDFFDGVTEASIDKDNRTVKGVCVFGRRESANKRIYQDRAIESICRLADGTKCYLNHPTKTELREREGVRDLRDWAGVYVNPRKQGDKVFADLVVREQYFPLVQDIAVMKPANVGNSINARVKTASDEKGMENVADVESLKSIDLVASAATTTSLFEAALEQNSKEEKDGLVQYFAEWLLLQQGFQVTESLLKDKIANDKIQREISDLSWTAQDMITGILQDTEKGLTWEQKKSKIMAVFDELAEEVKKRVPKAGTDAGTGVGSSPQSEASKEAEKGGDEGAMEITVEMLRKDHSEIVEALLAEQKESASREKAAFEAKIQERDGKVMELTESVRQKDEEIKGLKTRLDEKEVAERLAEKEMMILEATKGLPKEVMTEIFLEDLRAVQEKKGDGDAVITIKEQIEQRVEDRKKILSLSKGKIKGSGDQFVEDLGRTKKAFSGTQEVSEAVEDFISMVKS